MQTKNIILLLKNGGHFKSYLFNINWGITSTEAICPITKVLFSFIGNHKKTSILRSKWKPCLIKEMWARLQKLRGPSYFYAGQKDSPPCWRRPIDATRAAWAAWSASRPGCSGSPRWCGGAGKPSSTRTEWPGRRLSMEEKERQSVRVNRADGLFPYAKVKGVVLVGKSGER